MHERTLDARGIRWRRTALRWSALAAVVATALTGCVIPPPPVATPSSPPSTTPTVPAAPTSTPLQPVDVSTDGAGPFTVDDGLGDTWTYTVRGYRVVAESHPMLPDGFMAIALVVDATHDAGSSSWGVCFETTVTTSSGAYSSDDTASFLLDLPDDAAPARDDFTAGEVVVAVPAGTVDGVFSVSSSYGDDSRRFAFPG